MEHFIQTFHFLRPQWLWALIPLGLLLGLLMFTTRKQSNWQQICDRHLLTSLLVNADNARQILPFFLLATGWLIATLAMAGPIWTQVEVPIYQNLSARVIALDLSTAMEAKDIPPSRISRARFKVSDLLQKTHEGQTGLVVFAREPYVVSPLTEDAKTINSMVSSLEPDIMPVQGHDIGRALEKAAKLIKQTGTETGEILLITSGPVTARDKKIAATLKSEGYTTSVLAMGSEQGAPVPLPEGGFLKNRQGELVLSKQDKAGLKALAQEGGGQYVPFSTNNKDIDQLIRESLNEQLQMQAGESKQKSERFADDGRWLVFLLLPIALLGFRRGWLG